MKLGVGFITYNEASAPYLPYFLPSLNKALDFLNPADYQILVRDNSSANHLNNRQALTTYQEQLSIQLIRPELTANLGFSRAYNLLIRQAQELGAVYFLIINPDTLLEPTAIQLLLQALEENKQLVSASPKLRRWDFINHQKTQYLDSVGLGLRPGLKFVDLGQGVIDRGQFDNQDILGPSGAAGLFRLMALRQIQEKGQYFDERFFMYKEDCDLNYRLSLQGGLSRLVPTAIIYHDRTIAAQPGCMAQWTARRQISRQVRAWSFLNQHLLFVKHWSDQDCIGKIIIIWRSFFYIIFSLILEQYNLISYYKWRRQQKVLTNIK